jgi:hypothetical protein
MINFEVIVDLIFLISCLVDNFSAMTIRVPSDRTTFSRGEIKRAKGRAIHSMIRNAMYVSGVTPPVTPLTWFLDKLMVSRDFTRYSRNLLDSTAD